MSKIVFLVWLLPLVFMSVAFYVLLRSDTSVTAKVVFTVVPVSIWILGGITIYREYHDQEMERRREEEILEEAKRLLRDPKDPVNKSRHQRKA